MESHQHGEHRRRAVLYRGLVSEPIIGTDVLSPFFNYGRGFFETILYEKGKLQFYDDHLERMKKTCYDFSISLDYSQIKKSKVLAYLEQESLKDHCCRVKIIYAPIKDSSRWDTVVSAAPYTRPLQDFALSIHKEVRDTKMCRYKSLNYGYNLHWKEYYANLNRSDEALLLNREGNILEGTYTNVLILKDSRLYYVGRDQNYLQGIMQNQVLKAAASLNVKTQALDSGIPLEMLKEADEIMLCNSLMAVKKAIKVFDEKDICSWDSSAAGSHLSEKLTRLISQ